MSRFRRFTLPVLALAAALAGCGSSATTTSTSTTAAVTPASYMKSVCTAVGTFERSVLQRSSALKASGAPGRSKQARVTFLQGVVADAEQVVTELKGAGTPKVPKGGSISSGIVTAFTELHSALARTVVQAQNITTRNRTTYLAQTRALALAFASSLRTVEQRLSVLTDKQLNQAAATEPACKSLNQQSG